MPGMMLNPIRLSALLKPNGFSLRDSNAHLKTIDFVRPSSISRLFEHLAIHGQGKRGEAVYATTFISGAACVAVDPCIAERDLSLMFALEENAERHWSVLQSDADAKAWEKKLASLAADYCQATTGSLGSALIERLNPTFETVDRYFERIGDVGAIFDREYSYFEEAFEVDRNSALHLASMIGPALFEDSQNVELSCLILFKFGSMVEGRPNPFVGKKWHEDDALRARIYLLLDFIRQKRSEYQPGI